MGPIWENNTAWRQSHLISGILLEVESIMTGCTCYVCIYLFTLIVHPCSYTATVCVHMIGHTYCTPLLLWYIHTHLL